MNKTFTHLLSVFVLIFLASCQLSEKTESDIYTGSYLAHVQLDSTMLIATEVMNGLESPWDINVDPEGWVWVTELEGVISRVNPETGESMKLLQMTDLNRTRGRGLWSKVLHPDFEENPYVYLHYTFAEEELGSRIVRYTFRGDTLTDRTVILDKLPGGQGHNGSRMMIGPDNKLWMGTGDSHRGDLAQNPETYHGKVLRMNLDGSIPDDNPFGDSRVWSTGHRNIQGITHGNSHIYTSEHGAAANDEVNLIQKGRNYGWPDVQGFCDSEAERQYCRDSLIVEPLIAFDPAVPPAGMEFYGYDAIPEWNNSLIMSTLRVQTLRILHLDKIGEQIENNQIFFQQHFGRIRDVAVDQQGRVFLLTSNTDWYRESRPDIHDPELVVHGDKIIMLQYADETLLARFENIENKQILEENRIPRYLGDSEILDDMRAGEQLYLAHCASCHLQDGAGMEGIVPPLTGSDWVAGSREGLIDMMLNGIPEDEKSGDFDWDMPVYSSLDDDEIAAILNYIREEFSTETDYFSPDDVEEVRNAGR
jgi:aldose sugar dehydrogenase